MDAYLIIKWVHVVSSTILFGTGLGSAFYMFMANRRKDIAAIYFAVRHVVIADWLFTTPAIIVQLVTGLFMAHIGGIDLTARWVKWALGLYFFAGACWLPVLWMQLKMREMARVALETKGELPALYWKMDRLWTTLGVFAFSAVFVIFYLMVVKPG